MPKKLQEALPFASKPKVPSKRKEPTYLAKRAVVMEKDERKKHTLLQMVNSMRNDKLRMQREKQAERTAKLHKKRAKIEVRHSLMRCPPPCPPHRPLLLLHCCGAVLFRALLLC